MSHALGLDGLLPSVISGLLFATAAFAQGADPVDQFPFGEGAVTITARIEDYRGVYRTGTLSLFDGVTRQSREQEFEIDEDGRFRIEETLPHAVYGCAVLDLEGEYHPLFLEPGMKLELECDGSGVRFMGASGALNRELTIYSTTAATDLAKAIEEFEAVHASGSTYADAVAAYRLHAERRREHFAEFARKNDFWATWCAPCRAEIPDAKRLERKLASEDVVFLNLCARSRKQDWSRMVAQKELGGEQMFLEDSEYEMLARRFAVRGFPTYVLIGKDGKVASKSAPRPSSGDEIETLIRSLLR